MKNRIIALFLAACIVMSFTVCASADGADMVNPMNAMPDYQTLADAQPTIKLNDVPEGATDVSYGWLNNIPAIDQIDFTYDGHTYCYRAAACPDGSASFDISGVYEQFPSISTVNVSCENQAGGSYVLRYDAQAGKGVANWVSEMAETQYSLYSADACKGKKIEEMPIYEIMDMLFIYAQDAKTVSGTVVDATNNTIALNLTDGNSAVLNCEHLKTVTVDTNDQVDVLYLGEIDGDAEVVKISLSDGDTSSAAGDTFTGNIFRYIDNYIYLQTSDNNVFSFEITGSTSVSGAATRLAENEDVIVTYTGDLYDDPVAIDVNVTKVGATPKPSPAPTASPIYRDTYTEGVVTAVGGIWVTVNGIVFEVNGARCYISGTPSVGCYANINYRDYGSYKVVTAAYFSSLPAPTPTPSRKTMIATGNIVGLNWPYITIEGEGYGAVSQSFAVNTSNIEGTPAVGGYARIDYYDYGNGYTEVTYAKFSPPQPAPYDVRYASGNAYNYTGSGIEIGGQHFYINGGTVIVGSFVSGCYAEVTYNAWQDGSSEATYIIFYPPTPVPTQEPIVGPVGAGWTCTVCGTRNGVYDVYCSGCGTSRSGTGFIGDALE